MLAVDRDVDDDRTFEFVVERHRRLDCPHRFTVDERFGDPEPA